MPLPISIHVPAWGTTLRQRQQLLDMDNFNPRSRVGNDGYTAPIVLNMDDFNPRSRVGNDLRQPIVLILPMIFQSTFPRGERQQGKLLELPDLHFNPRSRVGNDAIPRGTRSPF